MGELFEGCLKGGGGVLPVQVVPLVYTENGGGVDHDDATVLLPERVTDKRRSAGKERFPRVRLSLSFLEDSGTLRLEDRLHNLSEKPELSAEMVVEGTPGD